VVVLVAGGLLLLLGVLASLGVLEEVPDGELVLLRQGGDELDDFPVADEQFEE
jgi:hypothetical protein